MAVEDATTTDGGPARTLLRQLGDWALQAAPAVAGAIGFVGFVSLLGAAIQWVRFAAAGLPADQAIDAMPRGELVVIGAVSLVGFTIAGALAVLLVYLLDRRGDASVPTLWALVFLGALELAVATVFVDVDGWIEWAVWGGIPVLGLLTAIGLRGLPGRLTEQVQREVVEDSVRAARTDFAAAADAVEDARQHVQLAQQSNAAGYPAAVTAHNDAKVALAGARRTWFEAVDDWLGLMRPTLEPASLEALRAAQRPLREAEVEVLLDRARAERHRETYVLRLPRRDAVPIALVGLIAIGSVVALALEEDTRGLAVLVATVYALALMNLGVARATRRFAWYGISVFVSVMLFGAALSIQRTIESPKVQPAALARTSTDPALCGVYVTQTDDRVYLGRVEAEDDGDAKRGAGRIFWVPRADVEVLNIGALQGVDGVEASARELLREVYADRPAVAPPAVKPVTRKTVTGAPDKPKGQVTVEEQVATEAPRPKARPTPELPASCSEAKL